MGSPKAYGNYKSKKRNKQLKEWAAANKKKNKKAGGFRLLPFTVAYL